ncbi:AI-2E family transporter [Geomonas sp. RF6]|uniref:AI-2E family transporter n=1 Tax=Geomonas sp. RF6 TaxID=2897342 RepID=UPI001E374F2C|nr:AI-2E family transporter [Geomonas sp. RF6]UFS70754.1 AI-2E family transporter [Geomonas sp. RF6]
MDRTLFFTLLAYTFALLLLYLLFLILAPFLSTLVWASAIGIITFPLFEKVLERCRGRRNAASGLMTLLVCLVLVLPLVGLIFTLSQEVAQAYQYLERATAGAGGMPTFDTILRQPWLSALVAKVKPLVGSLNLDLDKVLLPTAKQGASHLLNYLTGIAKNFIGFLMKLFMMLIILFFVYRDGPGYVRAFWEVIVLREGLKQNIFQTLERVLGAIMYGVVLTCLVQGALGGLGFWVAGLPSPLLFGTLMAICAIIPVVGTALIWVPGALFLLVQGEILKGVLLIAWCVIAVSSIDNVIRPLFISGKAKLPILLVALGGLGGLVTMGITGIVAGPVILALFQVFFESLRRDNGVVPVGTAPDGTRPPRAPVP